MPSTKNNKLNKLKRLKILLVPVVILVTLTVFVGYRRFVHQKENMVSDFQDKANISIGNVHQTATRNGVTQWSLDAASMNYFAKEKQSIFKDLAVTFYLEDKSEIYLTANQGILKTGSSDMKVDGNVIVDNGDYRLKTDKLYYNHNKQIIFSKTPVKITGKSLNLAADSMFFNLNTKKAELEGNVNGIIGEKIAL